MLLLLLFQVVFGPFHFSSETEFFCAFSPNESTNRLNKDVISRLDCIIKQTNKKKNQTFPLHNLLASHTSAASFLLQNMSAPFLVIITIFFILLFLQVKQPLKHNSDTKRNVDAFTFNCCLSGQFPFKHGKAQRKELQFYSSVFSFKHTHMHTSTECTGTANSKCNNQTRRIKKAIYGALLFTFFVCSDWLKRYLMRVTYLFNCFLCCINVCSATTSETQKITTTLHKIGREKKHTKKYLPKQNHHVMLQP